MDSSWWVTVAFVCSDARYCWWEEGQALHWLNLGCVRPHPSPSLSQKKPRVLCLCVTYWACFSGADGTTFEWCLLGSHWNPSLLISVGNQNSGCFWSFPISPCVFWLLEVRLSFLGLGQHLSFLLCRTPGSLCVTLCQDSSSRGGPELGPWPSVLFSVLALLESLS